MTKMKMFVTVCVVAALAVSAAQAAPSYFVDLGTLASEAGYGLADWGPIQPSTSGGNWGGMGSGTAPGSYDQLCRTVWGHTGDLNWAAVRFPMPIYSATIRHLVGQADDSYTIKVLAGGYDWGSFVDTAGGETWTSTTFKGTPDKTLVITATGPAWSGFATYGQLGVDWISATPIPAPGAVLLGSLGAGLVGWLRRRRTL